MASYQFNVKNLVEHEASRSGVAYKKCRTTQPVNVSVYDFYFTDKRFHASGIQANPIGELKVIYWIEPIELINSLRVRGREEEATALDHLLQNRDWVILGVEESKSRRRYIFGSRPSCESEPEVITKYVGGGQGEEAGGGGAPPAAKAGMFSPAILMFGGAALLFALILALARRR